MSEPKEWWIDPDYEGYFGSTNENLIAAGFVRAIEKSAYESAIKDRDVACADIIKVLDERDEARGLNDLLLLDCDKIRDLLAAERAKAAKLEALLQDIFDLAKGYGKNGLNFLAHTEYEERWKELKATQEESGRVS